MPRFYEYEEVEVNIDIDVDDFLNKCSSKETEELIDALIEDGYLIKNCRKGFTYHEHSVAEQIYVQAIEKLRDKWNMLTQEEEQIILKIANRF
jgi:Zn-finger protein